MILEFLAFNLVFIIIVYAVATSGIIRSVKPIVQGIEALGEQKEVYIPEKGLMSQLAASINRVSEKLKTQNYALRKKETARANWIAGVSHDIRTPLSMVMGHASTLEEDVGLPEEARQKAGIIRRQSIRMKNLINDLNLASKLEYNVQPVKRQRTDLVALARTVAVDFLNLDNAGDYPIVWNTAEDTGPMMIDGDPDLLKRAMSNLITNAQVHNPRGCTIGVEVKRRGGNVCPDRLRRRSGGHRRRTPVHPERASLYGLRQQHRGTAPWSGAADRKTDRPGSWRKGGAGSLSSGRISGEDPASERWGGNLTFLQDWKFISKFLWKQVTILPGDEYENITCRRRSDPGGRNRETLPEMGL